MNLHIIWTGQLTHRYLLQLPYFKNFKGVIEEVDDQQYDVYGKVATLDEEKIEITELPIRMWTQKYKADVLEPMLHGTDKVPATIT